MTVAANAHGPEAGPDANSAAGEAAYLAVISAFQDAVDSLRAGREAEGQPLLRAATELIAQLQRDERLPLCLANAPYPVISRLAGRQLLGPLVIHGANAMAYSLKISRDLGVPERRLPCIALAAQFRNLGLLAASDQELRQFNEGANHAEVFLRLEAHRLDYLRRIRLPQDCQESLIELLSLAHDDEQALSRTSMHEAMYQYAMTIHVCGVFEQLTHQRTYGVVLSPVDALKKMRDEMRDCFHPEIVKLFFDHLSIYPLGCFVQLSSRETAKVVALNPGYIMRPVVCIILDENGQEKPTPVRLNLRDKPNLYIKRAIMDENLSERYLRLI